MKSLKTRGLAWQRQILSAVARRGYVNGWQPEEFIARQAVKLLEEACELFLAFSWPTSAKFNQLRESVVTLKAYASWTFDEESLWRGGDVADQIINMPAVLSECADCMVVLANIAEMQREMTGEAFALLPKAAAKATGDIERGVRSG